MAIAILQLDSGLELRSDDSLTCRTMYRLMASSISPDDREKLIDAPAPTDDPVT
jgi:hypothetical protein